MTTRGTERSRATEPTEERCFFCREPKLAPYVDWFMSAFGNIRVPGMATLLNSHEIKRRWVWVTGEGIGRTYLIDKCARDCRACAMERAIEGLAEECYKRHHDLQEVVVKGF